MLLLSMSLVGCNSQGTAPAQNNQSGGNTASSGGSSSGGGGGGEKILIATQSPLSGSQSAIGDAIKTGAGFAIEKRKEEFKQLGFDLQLFPQDDQADPKIGVSNAEMLVANPDVLGVVGHFNTGVAIPSSVKYESGSLVMVSPANSGVTLTEEGKKTVHRICARDDAQGPKGAKYAKEVLGVKSVFLIHDKTAYGQGLVDQVKAQFEKDGVQVLGYEGVNQGEKDYNFVVNTAVASKPDMIYFGGIYPEAGIIVKQAREKGYTGMFMGGDGIDSPDLIKIAGAAAEGVYLTALAGDAKQSEEGRKWAEEYEKVMGKKPGTYSDYAYESANVILDGLAAAIKENGGKKPTREQVLEKVHSTKDYQGKFVKVTFDEKGDNEFADVFMYKFEKEGTKFIGKIE
ncbi:MULTISPECIES: branched-chain amino acid ABC transporter substrate-binding protein [Brevibacillus]|jgi:branched-chain amino acid transport system substrate-binding protein|nr:branched-chain amino acid ABC transporter substrate-binding protein [Brevibacillus borstelensis]KKX56658.1 ABC transporter substrate-binding protein [Brevibacillus borstelensis cifa_chp40]MBE5395360.1 branched-chain amino acid ABC transporter substrate-binding protein [Brevibacillus borstelensis]MCC0562812.1 branched-chain amino acid ABC transporter substrate-binding protein [Brevibacillus borstelensis]MCM3468722.1 branched-chain amino acid ABC transporter substrate-binding protein [Brevibac